MVNNHPKDPNSNNTYEDKYHEQKLLRKTSRRAVYLVHLKSDPSKKYVSKRVKLSGTEKSLKTAETEVLTFPLKTLFYTIILIPFFNYLYLHTSIGIHNKKLQSPEHSKLRRVLLHPRVHDHYNRVLRTRRPRRAYKRNQGKKPGIKRRVYSLSHGPDVTRAKLLTQKPNHAQGHQTWKHFHCKQWWNKARRFG